ncbi:SIR2 family protein [Mesobacillus subterraneus]|uniref:SIR2 family protein n=1 Tax=Mesobacillus subterraneus TaxID=285983 RepID=UPI00203CA1B4|nr:SIR2 family protein [Mesobacillus subterraneus]MCM3576403.1 SIR2 family protein [Mesobacillus subterraneus]
MINIHPYYIKGGINEVIPSDAHIIADLPNVSLYKQNDKAEELELSIEQIKQRVQPFIQSPNLSVLIGSGCSVDAIPLMGRTFKDIKEEIENVDLLGDYTGENPDIEGCLNWLVAGLQFLKEGTEEYSDYHQLYYTILSKLKESIINTTPENNEKVIRNHSKFFNSLFNVRNNPKYQPINIFTTNYDLFIERALERIKVHYTNGFNGLIEREFDPSVFRLRFVDDENRYKERWDPVSRFARLYKLHGSINWYYQDKRLFEKIGQDHHSDNENTVIYPTLNKHTQTLQTPYSELFREFSLQLQKPNTTLIIMGYGFPDTHINQLIQQALSNESFTLIVFGNITESGLNQFYNNNLSKQNLHIIGGQHTEGMMVHYYSSIVEKIINISRDEHV